MTVDYRNQRIEFRQPGYNSELHGLPNSWFGIRDGNTSWYPTAILDVDGKHCKFVVDTGSTTSCLDIKYARARGFLRRKWVRPDGAYGTKIETYDTPHALNVSIGGRRIGVIQETMAIASAGDGYLGNDILRNCKLTIDYPDGITYLEPYDKVDVATAH